MSSYDVEWPYHVVDAEKLSFSIFTIKISYDITKQKILYI